MPLPFVWGSALTCVSAAPAMQMFDAFLCEMRPEGATGSALAEKAGKRWPGAGWWCFAAGFGSGSGAAAANGARRCSQTRFTCRFGAGNFGGFVIIGINFPAGSWGRSIAPGCCLRWAAMGVWRVPAGSGAGSPHACTHACGLHVRVSVCRSTCLPELIFLW